MSAPTVTFAASANGRQIIGTWSRAVDQGLGGDLDLRVNGATVNAAEGSQEGSTSTWDVQGMRITHGATVTASLVADAVEANDDATPNATITAQAVDTSTITAGGQTARGRDSHLDRLRR